MIRISKLNPHTTHPHRLEMQHMRAHVTNDTIDNESTWATPPPSITSTKSVVYTGNNLSTKVTDLQPGTYYSFTITACNTVGCSPPSPPCTITTPLLPPAAPNGVRLELCEAGVRAAWNVPRACEAQSRAMVSAYELEVTKTHTGSGGSPNGAATKQLLTVSAKQCNHTLSALGSAVHCQLRVRALGTGGAGAGPWSSVASVVTVASPDKGTHDAATGGPSGAPSGRRKHSTVSSGGQSPRGGASPAHAAAGGPSRTALLGTTSTAVAKRPPKRRAPMQRVVQWVASWALCLALCAAGVAVLYAVVVAQ